MRITNSMMVSNYLSNLNTSMNKMSNLQGQLATNRKYMHISDDPVSLIYSQQARAKLHSLSIYEANVQTGQEWLTQTETAVMELNILIQTAYEQTIDASTDVKSDSDRQAIAQYVGQLRDQVLSVLNSTYGNKYVFGGYNTTGHVASSQLNPPFAYAEVDIVSGDPTQGQKRVLTYNGIDVANPGADAGKLALIAADEVNLDMGAGIRMDVSMNGVGVMNFTQSDGTAWNIYNMLDELTRTMNTAVDGDQIVADIQAFIKPLQDAQSHVLALTADLGGKTNRLDLMASRYGQDTINYTQMMSNAEDADQAEVIMRFKMAEAVYQAALATGSYVIQPTLMDFLK